MEDIIDIIVTETTNTIEITAQPNDEIIDVNIIDNREDIVLNVTPTVVEININSLTSNFGVSWGQITGTLSNQTDLNNALALKANLVGGKVPASELPSYVDDVVEVANFAALPATGETGKIYITLDNNKIYRWSGSVYVEIADSTAVWGAITGTLSSQTDLQNALNAKFDDPTGDTTQYIAGDGSLITFPVAGQAGTLVREVRNTTGATLTKGTIVYISGATGNKPTVSKAIATGDSTSAQTFGMCQANIANNSNGYVVCVGDLGGLDTSGLTEGNQLYLSSTTAGTYTTTKQLAPAHLVYIGVVTRAHPTLGQIEVKIQNGYELNEIHDVAISSLANNDGLFYESATDLWKNKSIATVLGYTPQAQLNGTGFVKASGTTISYDNSTYALDNSVVKLTGNQSVAGIKTFTSGVSAELLWIKEGAGFANPAGYAQLATDITYFHFNNSNNTAFARFLYGSGQRIYTLPNSDGTIALTSNLSAYLPLAGGTMTGAIVGTTASFAMSGSGIALEATSSGTGDAIRITHSSGRALTLNSSGSGFGILINNDTAATSAPFTIQKTGAAVVTLTDVGAGVFSSSLRSSGYYLTGMTAGSGALYYSSGANRVTVANYNASGIVTFEVNGGFTALTLNSNLSATFASTLSATGATLTGALSGTSATFSGTFEAGRTGGGVTAGDLSIDITSTAAKVIIGRLSTVGSDNTTLIGRNRVGAQGWSIDSFGVASFNSSVTATIFDSTSNAFRFSGSNALSLVSLGGQNVVKINAAGYWGTQLVGANDQGILVNNSGNVGIGTTAPTNARLEVVGGIPTLFTADSQASSPTYGGSIFYRNHTGTDQGNGLTFSLNNSSGTRSEYAYIGGVIETNTSGSHNGAILFAPASGGNRTERMRITSDGYARLSSSSGGIQFNGDTAAANALDDYEEGTFTPGLTFGGGSTGMTFFDRAGVYTKIGRQVTCTIYLALTAKGSSTGQALLTNLPFVNGNYNRGSSSVANIRFDNISYSGSVQIFVSASSSSISFEQVSDAGTDSQITNTNFNDSTEMSITVTYFV
jgi:hypothetical protein